MCCIIDSFLSDLFTLVRQLIVWITARFTPQSTTTLGGQHKQDRKRHNKHFYQDHFKQKGGYKQQEYKMMSKKGLLKFVKYTLIFSNAFGFILSIFLGLFGIAYPDKHFPLSYKGREMALCSLFCMLFTTIGYCGAQNHRRILLIIYGATNVIIVIIVVILWFLFKENSILGNKEISNMFITTLAITIAVMFLFSFILAFHIQTFKDNQQDSIVSQSHQLLQQTTAFLQQQQHQQQHQLPSSSGHQHQQHHTLPRHQQQHHPGQHEMDTLHDHRHQPHLGHMSGPHGNHLQTSMAISAHQLPPPPPPLKHLHQHQHQAAGGGKPSIQLGQQAPAQLQQHPSTMLPPPQVPPAGQIGLMRNQSSPLPVGAGAQLTYQPIAQHQRPSSSSKTSNQQHYQQSKLQSSAQTQMIQPPPPSPPSIHHHSMRGDHHRHHQPPPPSGMGGSGGGSSAIAGSAGAGVRLPPCPVQYCTFQCDRTV